MIADASKKRKIRFRLQRAYKGLPRFKVSAHLAASIREISAASLAELMRLDLDLETWSPVQDADSTSKHPSRTANAACQTEAMHFDELSPTVPVARTFTADSITSGFVVQSPRARVFALDE